MVHLRPHPWRVLPLIVLGAAPAWAQSVARDESSAAGMISGWDRFTSTLMEKSAAFGSALRDFPNQLDRAFDLLGHGKGFWGVVATLGLTALLFAVVLLLEWIASRRVRRFGQGLLAFGAQSLGQRLSAITIGALTDCLAIVLFVALGMVALRLVFATGDPARGLAASIGLAIVATRLLAIPIRLALSAGNAENRMVPVSDADAKRLVRWCITIAALASVAYFGSGFLALLDFPKQIVNAWFLIFGIALTIGVLCLVWRYGRGHRPIHAPANMGAVATPAATMSGFLSANYHRIIAALIGLSWVLWWINLIIDRRQQANAILLSVAFIVLFPPIDRCYRTVLGWAAERKREGGCLPSAPATWPIGYRLVLMTTRIVLVAAIAILAFEAWGVPVLDWLTSPTGRRLTHALATLAIAVPLAMLVWHGSKAFLERKLGHARAEGDEAPGTRGHTLLPIMRGFLLVLLFVIVAMMVLASLGVEIGPLLAGAGVVGLAVGFGAQTLVRDIFSGFFFLLDDAFRIGEYIDAGKAKGTVEKISIRSLQLRHHRGALHTVPYGQIQLISNYHRDWVIEKLEFGLVYGTDPEKVRKLVKKIGQEMMQDPALAPDMLEPLKSQGVQRFGDSAVIFRAKIKCPPGRQFKVRQEAYRRMQEIFTENGIEFAYPTVTVSGGAGEVAETKAVARAGAKPTEAAHAGA